MPKFIAFYLVPSAVIEQWTKTDPDTRRPAEERMHTAFDAWMRDHAAMVGAVEMAGKTKRVTHDGIADAKNDIVMYGFVEADSHEAAAAIFANHPHLQIPQSSIEITAVRSMAGD